MSRPSIPQLFQYGLLGLAILGGCVAASAQGGVGSTRGLPETSGGTNTIQGHIYFPEGEIGNRRVRVSLESTDQDASKSTQSDADGSFFFNRLKPGSYTIVVDGGKDYDNVTEPVFFEGSYRNVVIPINLKVKGAAAAAFAGIPKSAVDLYKKAQESSQKNEYKKSVDFLNSALAQAPNFALALSDLGMAYLKLNQMDKAAETYATLLKVKPDASAHLNMGIALYNVGLALLTDKKVDEANQKLGEAQQHLTEAIKEKSPGPNANYYLGLVLIRERKYPEAQAALEAAISSGGENLPLAHRFLGGLYKGAGRNKDAADQLEKYLQMDPKAKDAEQIRGTIKELRSN